MSYPAQGELGPDSVHKGISEIENNKKVPRGDQDQKKRPGVDFFFRASLAGLTNLHNQKHV